MSESTSEPVTPPAAPTVHETPNIAAPPLTRSGSPPPPPPQLPGDTPIRRSLASHNPHVTDHTVFYETPFARAAEEMKDSYMEVDTLSILDLLPECTGMPEVEYGLFKAVGEEKTETRMYDPFIKAMENYIKTGWTLVNTSNSADPTILPVFGGHLIMPDVTLYAPGCYPGERKTDASKAELFGEFKVTSQSEPFRKETAEELQKKRDPLSDKDPLQLPPFEHPTIHATLTRGQLTTYLNAIQATQNRTRVFLFFIRANWCRLLCHSRAGTQVTHLFDYTTEPHLHTFLWRLTHADPADRGHDVTFLPISEEESPDIVAGARKALDIDGSHTLYKVSVVAEGKETKTELVVSQSLVKTHTYPIGRGTRCFKAYNASLDSVVFLKDTWRIEEYSQEHKIYEKLNANAVPCIANVVVAGDVPGKFQKTPTMGRRLIHYRLVLDTVGKPLSAFSSTHELIKAVRDALRAHQQAWMCMSLLHRDISFGNIIIVEGGGMLIDWERAKTYKELQNEVDEAENLAVSTSRDEVDSGVDKAESLAKPKPPSPKYRTGTWQFMSIRMLRVPDSAIHSVADDLESFIHVIMWVAARFAPNTMSAEERKRFLAQFDDNNNASPGAAKRALFLTGISVVDDLQLDTTPFRNVLEELALSVQYAIDHDLAWLRTFKRSGVNLQEREVESRLGQLKTHDWVAKTLLAALEDANWKDIADGAVSHPVGVVKPTATVQERKRISEFSSYHAMSSKRQKT